MKKLIYIHQPLLPKHVEELKTLASEYEVVESLEGVDANQIEIIVGWSDELLSIVEHDDSQVKWVQFFYAGVNKLPLNLFEEKGILLTNGSGINAHSVSELAMGLLLGLSRKIVQSTKNQAEKKWERKGFYFELANKTMVIVGTGQIGVQLGKVAQAFGMHTIGINRSGRKVEHMNEQFTIDELPEVLHKGDVVVNILPLTIETEQYYDKALFSKMKDGVTFINVGRGESVVSADLIDALDSGKISRAGLDVFEVEPLPMNDPFWEHENVLVTPHIAGQVGDYSEFIYPIFKENLLAFQKGEELPVNRIELQRGY